MTWPRVLAKTEAFERWGPRPPACLELSMADIALHLFIARALPKRNLSSRAESPRKSKF